MGRRSRHSAKTGDQSIYKSRSADDDNNNDNSDDDEMYDEVDRFHNRKLKDEEAYLQLDRDDDGSDDDDSSEDDGITKGREGVFDLGIGGSSDEDDDISDDEQELMAESRSKKGAAGVQLASSSDDDGSSDDDDEEDDQKKSNLLNWGAKKHSYYHGDTADLEIGQDVDDAYLEEEAGREVEKARLEDMEEADFMLNGSDDDDDDDDDDDEDKVQEKPKKKPKKSSSSSSKIQEAEGVETLQSVKNAKQISKSSKKDKLKLLKANHPELLPLVQHFSGSVQDLVDSTMVAGGALLKNGAKAGRKEAKAIGATSAGLQYLITKSMLQASQALNLSLYLLLKADQASNASASADSGALFMDDDVVDDVRNHPVIDRLNQLSQLTDKLEKVEDNTSGLREQLSNLVKAATLVDGGDVSSSDDDSEVDVVDNVDESDDEEGSELGAAIEEQRDLTDKGSESSSDSEAEENEEAIQRRVMTEARFALRNQDLEQDNAASKTSKRKRRLAPSSYDYGDETEELTEKAVQAGRKLASAMNSISQKSATSSQKKKSQVGDEVERDEDEYEQLQRGLSMMEEEFGGGGSDEDGDGDSIGDEDGEEGFGDDDDDDDGFYQKIKSKSMAKKKAKKQMYAVAPKYPRLDNEVEGERTIGRTIMKNRGLVAHKPKINRNPRVKKREQYRKALIRRKGAVREIRKDEGHVYGGETTGIKSGISRSRKL